MHPEVAFSGRSSWQSFRRSRALVVTVVCIALMLDLVMLTTLEPILPDMLYRMERGEEYAFWQPMYSATNTSTEDSTKVGNVVPQYTSTTQKVGVVLAIKPGTEVIANLLVGALVERYGHKYPMICGCAANFLATIGFAFSPTFYLLLLARVIQAFGSSLSVVAGLALLACVFPGEDERSKVNGVALGGLSVGIIVGFPFGSTCYQFLGRAAPFLMLSCLMLVDGALRLAIKFPDQIKETVDNRVCDWRKLLTDPYVLVALGCNWLQHIALGIAIATQSAWMLEALSAVQWQIGVVLVTAAVFQLLALLCTGYLATRYGRWLFSMIGLILTSVGFALYPLCETVWQVIGPESVARLGLGVTLAIISPLLGYIVDTRHNSNYGAIYGLYAASYNFGLVVGPLVGGSILHYVGFRWLYRGTAIMLFAYSFLCLRLRSMESPGKVDQSCQKVKTTYGTLDSEPINQTPATE